MQRGVDYIGVGSGAMIFNKEGKVFIAKRGPKAKNERGKWDFPGGAIEFGEKCDDIAWVDLHDIQPEELTMPSKSNYFKYIDKYGFNFPTKI